MDPITIGWGLIALGGAISAALGNDSKKKNAVKEKKRQEEYEIEQHRKDALERQKQSVRDQMDRSSKSYLSDVTKIVR